MRSRRDTALGVLSILAAIVIANVLGDTIRVASFDSLRGAVVAAVTAAALAAASGAIFARLHSTPVARAVAIAAICAATIALLFVRLPSPWIDLGPFGSGPLTCVALVLLPAAQLAALLGLRTWGEPAQGDAAGLRR